MIGSLSSGYDSTAAAVLARAAGLEKVFSFRSARGGMPDHGEDIAGRLGLDLTLVDRAAWRQQPLAEVPYLAANALGQDIIFSSARDLLRGRVLVSGFIGDRVWGKESEVREAALARENTAGLSFTEHRLGLGCIHLPVPFIGARQMGDLVALSNSPELAAWDLPGDYSRPICRRIVEDAGVPREVRVEFHKKANRNSIRLEWEIPGKRDPIAEAVKIASESDVAIVFAGLSNLYEGGTQDRESLYLPDQQNKLISAVIRANPNTIVVLINGTPVAMPWIKEVPAILEAYYPGQEGGNAIARILFGEVNPSGKLPETFPRKLEDNPSYANFPGDPEKVKYEEGIYVGYRHYDKHNIEPLFPFGHGMSYTEFSYSNLQTEQTGNGLVKVAVEVKNTGLVPGKEVVQLYVSDPESSIEKPGKELKGFAKVFLEPGQSKPVSMALTRDQFAHFEAQQGQWVVEPGEFEIIIGSSSRDIRLRKKITIE